jgi:gamma-glutamyltranspeptidase / glutathione hydrolase
LILFTTSSSTEIVVLILLAFMMKVITVMAVASIAPHVLAHPAPHDTYPNPQHHARDKLGAVASESSVCSQIGVDLLKAGGNAADAVSETCLVSTISIFCCVNGIRGH